MIEGEGRLVAVSEPSATSASTASATASSTRSSAPARSSAVEGNKLTVAFDHAGEKRVIDTFVEPA